MVKFWARNIATRDHRKTGTKAKTRIVCLCFKSSRQCSVSFVHLLPALLSKPVVWPILDSLVRSNVGSAVYKQSLHSQSFLIAA